MPDNALATSAGWRTGAHALRAAVFNVPRELAPLGLRNKKAVVDLLFRASGKTLIEAAGDSRHLGANVGFFSVLHTWEQRLLFHPLVARVLAAGDLAHRLPGEEVRLRLRQLLLPN